MKKNLQLPFSELTAITPLDGRYRSRIDELSEIVSEYGLIINRLHIEAAYLLALSDAGITRKFSIEEKKRLLKMKIVLKVIEKLVLFSLLICFTDTNFF